MLKLSTVKLNFSNMANFPIRQQSFSLVFDDIVKISYIRLDYLNQLFFPTQFFSTTLSNLNNKNKRKQIMIICNLLYVFSNMNQSNFFQQTIDKNNKMHMFAIKRKNKTNKMTVFQITIPIQNASLEYGLYKS